MWGLHQLFEWLHGNVRYNSLTFKFSVHFDKKLTFLSIFLVSFLVDMLRYLKEMGLMVIGLIKLVLLFLEYSWFCALQKRFIYQNRCPISKNEKSWFQMQNFIKWNISHFENNIVNTEISHAPISFRTIYLIAILLVLVCSNVHFQ